MRNRFTKRCNRREPSKAIAQRQKRERIAMILAEKIAIVAANPTVSGGAAPMLSEGLGILGAQPASAPVLAHRRIHGHAAIGIDGVLRVCQDRAREAKLG